MHFQNSIATLLAVAPTAWAFALTGCSSYNTGTGSGSYNTWASVGKCHDACISQYAFAIVQGSNCWCSNYAPATMVATTECNDPCPGYPYEFCGAPDSGLYGYLALNKQPLGTQALSSSASAAESTSAPTVTVPATGTVVPSSTSSAGSTNSIPSTTTFTTEPPHTWTVPYASIKTLQGSAITVTVTPTIVPTTILNFPQQTDDQVVAGPNQDSFWGNTGKVAGTFTVVGILGAALIGGALFFFWRRYRSDHDDRMTVTSNEDGPTADNGAPYMVDRRRSNLTLATAGLAGLTRGSSHDKSPTETKTPAQMSRRGSQPMPYDQRLNPVALWNAHPNGSHVSVATFQDERDYSRPVLHVRNPDH